MNVQQALSARVLEATASGVTVAWALSPRNAPSPRVVLWLVAGTFDVALDGPTGLRTASVQVDCWGTSYKEAENLAAAVLGVLNGWASQGDKVHGVFAVSRRDSEPRSDIADREFRVQLDFDVVFWV